MVSIEDNTAGPYQSPELAVDADELLHGQPM